MKLRIHDLMTKSVITAQPHHTVDHVRGLMERNHVHAVPITGPDGEPVGIVTTSDLAASGIKDGSPVSQHMISPVVTVPAYNDPSAAARVMRNHKCHHVVVTHEGRIEGIVSSFDLLKLVEEHQYVPKGS